MIGIIGGTSLFNIKLLENSTKKLIKTDFGEANVMINENTAFIPRHGKDRNIPPHQINHRENIMALKKLNVENIISVTSVGSLNSSLKPSTILIPQDYINFQNIPTFFDKKIFHIVPSLNEDLRKMIIKTAENIGINVIKKGIYIQTKGPRLETKAEINVLKNWGDVVGMTMASEATLAKELEINYANISIVENYCHGITEESLSMTEILKNAKKNSETVKKLILAVIRTMQN